jgi:hypothetical protein
MVDVFAWVELVGYCMILKGVQEDYKRNLNLEIQDVVHEVQRTFNLEGALDYS